MPPNSWKRPMGNNLGEEMIFIYYPKCTTCINAKKWLDDHGLSYTERHIKEKNPTAVEIKKWHKKSGLPLKKFFNTSGLVYRGLNLKEKLPNMSEEEMYDLLSTDGMLVKRPLLITETAVLIGFKAKDWEAALIN